MKRNFFLLLITFLTFISCDKEWSDKNELNINGKVKKATSIYYKIKKDSIGNIYNDTLKIDIVRLNRKGNIVDRITKAFSNNKIRDSIITEFKYNFKGQLYKEIYIMPENFTDFEVFYTYKDSLLIKTYSSHSEIELDEKLFIQYSEEYSYYPNGKLSYSEFTQIAINSKSKDTSFNQKNTLYYDKNGFLIKSKWTSSEEYLSNSIEKFKNDEKGLMIKEKNYNLKGELIDSTNFKYKFDKRNNWIKKEGFKNNELIEVTERVIE